MNTYRVAPNPQAFGGKWVVEWTFDGEFKGYISGDFETEAEAQFRAFTLARIEAGKDPPPL
jgi:hypothetical protein